MFSSAAARRISLVAAYGNRTVGRSVRRRDSKSQYDQVMEAPIAFSDSSLQRLRDSGCRGHVGLVGDDNQEEVRSLKPRTSVRNILVKLELLDVTMEDKAFRSGPLPG
jgi:hypothetical protein